MFKVEACDRNGVYLITVPYNVPEHLIKEYIIYYLPENVKARQQKEGGNNLREKRDDSEKEGRLK